MQRYVNLTSKTQTLHWNCQVFADRVQVTGRWIIIASKCTFSQGLHILSSIEQGVEYVPQFVELTDCEIPIDGNIYPISISAIATTARMPLVRIQGCVASGNGKAYTAADPQSGTPDNFAIRGVGQLELVDCISFDGGENGYSLNTCDSIRLRNCKAIGCDGQGFHIGRHPLTRADGFYWDGRVRLFNSQACLSADNFKNQLGISGSSCGHLIHNVDKAYVNDLISQGNQYVVSHQVVGREATLDINCTAYGAARTVLASRVVKVTQSIEMLG